MREIDFPPNGWDDVASFQPRDFLAAVTESSPSCRMNDELYGAVFRAAGRRYALSPALLRAIGAVLSGKRADFVSSSGKMGIMQLSPEVARFLRLQNPFDPVENIFGAARYLRLLLDRHDGNFRAALAAYYAGAAPGAATPGDASSREAEEFVTRVLALAAVEAGRQKKRPKGEILAELARLLQNGAKGGRADRA
ncbi:transglycosylase-like protein with SLT domain [Thermodesulfitimonas autotrophica]|uniref:Transglycosylase-like protein with SLT domain n=1 Tax=Thermodesulfitimonas autotrophica TaxID=1894989 RepID=A0A3N5B2U7_9THEO|nr:lytic transglycosylase domain-containing protein [Thermodesulfitimonas autotrophica]RPF43032.1 transglycosylase-like protein with SLT domain [Thermodesulfitimonas autotrophica]